MKKNVTDVIHEASSENMRKFFEGMGEITFVCKLDKLLAERGLNQKEFAQLSGLREATISQFITIKKSNINIGHLVLMMATLQITDISEIIEIQFEEALLNEMALNKARWLNTGELPDSLIMKKIER